jgi:hypothetical protein
LSSYVEKLDASAEYRFDISEGRTDRDAYLLIQR